MTGPQLKSARGAAGWSQEKTAARLGITQAYLSMMEKGQRSVPPDLAARIVSVLHAPPTALPLHGPERSSAAKLGFHSMLGALGYPGFAYLRRGRKRNPADVLFLALSQDDLDARVVEALPWVAFAFSDLDWNWLLSQAKLHDRQNRLGFVVQLAGEAAVRQSAAGPCSALEAVQSRLERSRLANEDTLCHDSMTEAERKWLRQRRPASAEHWNLLTDLTVDHLAWAA
ncbi:MAG TPA: helix-turn-helix transcriptional regulator [Verrucomicrobiae bacterium]|nr:helix-turn-helix transcriptional regulator [Verrucomicrobiae bacterium]